MPILLFLPFAASWVDQALATAGQIAMNQLGDSFSRQLSSIFSAATDSFTRPAQAAAWTRYVDRPPFHIISFDHWHFYPSPYPLPSNFAYISNINDDSLRSAVYGPDSVLYELRTGVYTRPWTFAFGAKVVMGGICDSYSPFHVIEHFSADFPNGDNSGRSFVVQLNGQRTTLFKAWESGCGAFADNLTWSEQDWAAIDASAAELTREWPHPAENYSAPTALTSSGTFDKKVGYAGLTQGAALSEAYIANCSAEVRKRVALAGYGMADYFGLFQLPVFEEAAAGRVIAGVKMPRAGSEIGAEEPDKEGGGVGASEVVSWVAMGVLAPIAGFMIWKRHCGMQ